MWLIAGLGNPGLKYQDTRHNLGFKALDILTEGQDWKSQNKALVSKGTFAGEQVLWVKPQTFMNLSGEAIQPLLSFYKIPPSKLIVFVDDVQLDCGKIRIRPKGSHGGQNGLRNIIEKLGDQFTRVRIGAGKCPPGWDMANWVLSKWSKDDEILCKEALNKAPEILETLFKSGLDQAMARFNA